MATPFYIDGATGGVRIGDTVLLAPHQPKASVEGQIADLLSGSRDHDNGYEWAHLTGLTFGDLPADLSLCFHDGCFEQAAWSVQLPNAVTEGGWPTRSAIDDEVSFVRNTLTKVMGLHTGRTPWGEIWSNFDAKGFLASSGLRYLPA